MTDVRKCPSCGKDMFPSKHSAAMACRTMGNTFRVYLCRGSGSWHVTKQTDPQGGVLARRKRANRKRTLHGE